MAHRLKLSKLYILIGTVLILSAMGITIYNYYTDYLCYYSMHYTLDSLEDAILQDANTNDIVTTSTLSASTNDAYMGILCIPSINAEYPVLNECSAKGMKSSPCRYYGTIAEDNVIVCGHNYVSCFGSLYTLSKGDTITITDTNGYTTRYTVSYLEVIDGKDVHSMCYGNPESWDLTLFTCTWNGLERVTVRAVRA